MKESVFKPMIPGKDPIHSKEKSFKSKVSNAVTSCVDQEMSEMCTKEYVQKRLPFTLWIPQYTFRFFINDMLAGLTVALTLIPQAMAYADVGGLPPQYGLYSAFMSSFTYIVLGSCKDITIGPTAIMGIMTHSFVVNNDSVDFAVLLCFLTGCIIVFVGLFRLGFLVDFISLPVISGFISAAAITIASTQLRSLLGIGGSGNDFIDSWKNVFERIKETQVGDVSLGICTIILLVIGRKLKDFDASRRNPSEMSTLRRIVGKVIWITSISRNTIVVVIGMILSYVLYKMGYKPFKITGTVAEGIPSFDLPPFSTYGKNETFYNFEDMIKIYGTSLFSVPFISILETIAIAKSFSKGKAVDATQELFALGMCNIMSSFAHSMPLAGSFSRTAVNNASGVKTPLGGLMTGVMVLLALSLLTSTFSYIPKATLAGVIISAVLFMVEYEMVPLLWRTKKVDLIPLLVTFLTSLGLGLDYGILAGIGVNLLFILYNSARPTIHARSLSVQSQEMLLLIPDQGLVFPAAEYIRDTVFTHCLKTEKHVIVIVDGSKVHHVDSTVAKNLTLLAEDMVIRKQKLVFWNWKPSVEVVCRGIDAKVTKYFHYEENLESLLQDLAADSDADDGAATTDGSATEDSTNGTQVTSLNSEPNV